METPTQNDQGTLATDRPNLSAMILAGGQSARMGRDKALIYVSDRPLLVQVYEVACQCADPVYIVTPWSERYRTILPEALFIQEHSLPTDTAPVPHGPLVGFAQGLAQVKTEWVLLLACDLPRLQVQTLQQWSRLLSDASTETIALLPRHPQGWWEALCGFYRQQCLISLNQFIEQGGRSFQRWLMGQTVQELVVPDRQMLMNCNTPADLERLS